MILITIYIKVSFVKINVLTNMNNAFITLFINIS